MKKNLLSVAVAATIMVPSMSVFAQEDAQTDAALVEEVIVTGSRIATDGLSSPSPVQVLDSTEIDVSGVANIQELLLKNPTMGSPTYSRTNSNFLTSSSGVSTIDLRNLGSDRTLVLVDGRRFVAGIPGTSAVDLNVIPTQFLERVEIMTGGASSLYGSDAVAGVVNMVYKKDWEGVELESKYSESAYGDGAETQYNLTLGGNIADGRGNVMVHGAYTNQGAIYSADRDRSDTDIASLGAYFTGNPDDFFTVVEPFYSSYSPQGRFFAGDTQFTYNADGSLKEGFDTNGDNGPADGFNRNGRRTIAVPTERYLLATRGTYEIADGINAFLEGTYAASQTTSRLEPFPLASDDIYAVDGYMPIEFADPNNPGSTIRNPFVADEIYAAAVDENGDGLKDISFTRRLADVGNRGNTADRDTFRVVAGFDAELTDNWKMDAYYTYGQTKESQVSGGQVNVLNFRNALEVVEDEFGNPICRDELARAQGCVAANVFGDGSLSAAADYITAPGLLATFVQQKVASVNITGDLFDLPAGSVGMAAGIEYREEFSRSEFDPLQQAGLNAGNAIPREEGSYDVSEAYMEVNVPILSGMFLAEELNLRGAVRGSDYSTVGSTESWNFGVEWAPISEVRFRAISAQSTRAPNITELYSPPSQTFPSVNDPCQGVTATSQGAKDDACRADAGVMANINANGGTFTLNQSDLQGVSGYNRGNPNLTEEVGKSLTVGAVITPEGIPVLEDFAFTVDYFDIEIEEAIVSTPRQFILEQCYGGDASYCQFVTRRASDAGANSAGSLEFVDSGASNAGGLVTEGIDLTVRYSKDLEELGLTGLFNARLAYTHVLDGYTIPLPGAEKDQWAGEVGAAENKFFLTMGYNYGDISVAWNTSFIGESYLDDGFMKSYGLEPETVSVDAIAYHDLNVSYNIQDKYELFAGIYNLTDEEPPMLITGLPGNDTGTETDAGTYDVIGRKYQVGFRVNF